MTSLPEGATPKDEPPLGHEGAGETPPLTAPALSDRAAVGERAGVRGGPSSPLTPTLSPVVLSNSSSDAARGEEGAGLPAFEPLDPLGRLFVLVLLALAAGASAYEITQRGIDPDELEHLHAAYLVSLGDVPYRDFFEHHAPASYYLLAPAFQIFGPTLSVLWVGRAVSVLCGGACLWLTGRLAERLGGRGCGLIAACLLAWSVVFHIKTLEFRPDVPATLLLLLAADRLWRPDVSLRAVLVGGLLAGIATTFTQKALVPAAGIWLGALMTIQLRIGCPGLDQREDGVPLAARPPVPSNRTLGTGGQAASGTPSSMTAAYAFGGAIPWAILFALFALWGAADDLWQGAIAQLWSWPVRMSPFQQLRPILAADLTIWFLAVCELFGITVPLLKGRAPHHLAVAMFVTLCVSSLFVVKAAYPQYYLLWMPGLAVLAARRLVLWLPGETNLRFLFVTGGLSFLLALLLYERLSPAMHFMGIQALPSLSPSLPRASLALQWGLLMLFGAVLFSTVHGYRRRAIFFLVVLGSFYGLLRNLDAHVWPNDAQVARIQAVNDAVPLDGRVFDGFTGYGALRRHAFYYWWLNPYSRAIAGEATLEASLLTSLKNAPPAAVLFDENVSNLPEPVTAWIKERYEPTEWDPLWLPKGTGQLTARP